MLQELKTTITQCIMVNMCSKFINKPCWSWFKDDVASTEISRIYHYQFNNSRQNWVRWRHFKTSKTIITLWTLCLENSSCSVIFIHKVVIHTLSFLFLYNTIVITTTEVITKPFRKTQFWWVHLNIIIHLLISFFQWFWINYSVCKCILYL